MVKECLDIWHKTTIKNANQIYKQGFKLSRRGTGAPGGKTDIRGISFGTGKYRYSDTQLAHDLGVEESDITKINARACLNIYKARQYGGHTKKKLMEEGYDSIMYPSGEIVIFNPEKIKMDKKYYMTCKESLDTYLGEELPSKTHENLTIDEANKLFDECREHAMFCRMGNMDEGGIVRDWVYGKPDFDICASEPYIERNVNRRK